MPRDFPRAALFRSLPAARCPLPAAPSHYEPRAPQPHAGLGQSQRPYPRGHRRRARLAEGLPAPFFPFAAPPSSASAPPVAARGCFSSRGRWPCLLHRVPSGRRRRAGRAVGPPGPGERRSAPGGGLRGARRERQSGGFPGRGCPAEHFPLRSFPCGLKGAAERCPSGWRGERRPLRPSLQPSPAEDRASSPARGRWGAGRCAHPLPRGWWPGPERTPPAGRCPSRGTGGVRLRSGLVSRDRGQ